MKKMPKAYEVCGFVVFRQGWSLVSCLLFLFSRGSTVQTYWIVFVFQYEYIKIHKQQPQYSHTDKLTKDKNSKEYLKQQQT